MKNLQMILCLSLAIFMYSGNGFADLLLDDTGTGWTAIGGDPSKAEIVDGEAIVDIGGFNSPTGRLARDLDGALASHYSWDMKTGSNNTWQTGVHLGAYDGNWHASDADYKATGCFAVVQCGVGYEGEGNDGKFAVYSGGFPSYGVLGDVAGTLGEWSHYDVQTDGGNLIVRIYERNEAFDTTPSAYLSTTPLTTIENDGFTLKETGNSMRLYSGSDNVVESDFGTGQTSFINIYSYSVPEPTMCSLLVFGGVGLFRYKRG